MKRIRYVSRFARDLAPAEIDALAAAAAEKNARLGITGVLLTSGRLFFQVVEGPDDAIDRLLAQIRHDDRHRDVFVLDEELDVRERDFPDWSMRGLHLDRFAEDRLAPGRALLQRLVACRQQLDELSQELQQLIWNELSLGAS